RGRCLDRCGVREVATEWTGPAQGVRLLALAVALAAFPGCAIRRTAGSPPAARALAHPEDTRLGRQAAAQTQTHPGQTGVCLLDSNLKAFQARVELADAAQKTLDVQSYIIWGDHTGRMLAGRILAAADRGVRVRILVDDVQMVWRDSWITRLDAHPNIELRVFNPFLGTRTFALLVLWDFLEAGRLSRRMHNKMFAADNAVAIMGGRNIGDEYFAARADLNFEDLDVLVIGPAVPELSRSFDDFWNSEWAYPVGDWKSEKEKAKDIRKARQGVETQRPQDSQSFFAEALAQEELLPPLLGGQLPWDWADARVVYDRPKKITGGSGREGGIRVVPEVWSLVESVQDELIVISPYFVPGAQGMALFRKLRQRGVRIRILTNSLGSTDTAVAQTGYARYRAALLREGIELYELRPTAMSRLLDRRWLRRHATRPQTSLHAKAYIFDRKTVFVGSMNLDQRAHYLNTELGLIIHSPAVAGKIAGMFEESILPQHSYRMALGRSQPGGSPKHAADPVGEWPVWVTEEKGRIIHHAHEPNVSLLRKVWTSFLQLLPLEGQL
ncbi:MAG: phospholipase D family protein, partial [Verrucomicrobia bacterium]|nr:phospholipase D family protein [Verrucomicrobiota bacterium]